MKKWWIVVECEIRVFLNSKAQVLGQVFIEPVTYIALFGAGIQSWIRELTLSSGESVSYLTFAFSGILCVQMVRSFSRGIYRVTVERRWGLYAMKRLAGVSPSAYLLGLVALPFSIFIVQAAVLLPFAELLGANISFSKLCIALLASIFLYPFWTCLALLITIAIRDYQQRDLVVSLSMMPMMFGAPLFYPMEQVPTYLAWILRINPLTYQVQTIRCILLDLPYKSYLFTSLALTVVVFILSIVALNRAELLSTEK